MQMDIYTKLREHIRALFSTAPPSRAAYELQEEILANCIEKYNDLTKNGMPEDFAYETVIGGIGNVDELLAALPPESGASYVDYTAMQAYEEDRMAKRALITTISVGLYILAGAVLFLFFFLDEKTNSGSFALLGVALAAVICIVPTCLLVFNAKRHPKYEKKDDTMVEDFKAWTNDEQKSKSLRRAISSLLWTLTTVIYLLISFTTWSWHITWIIFLIATCIDSAITLIFRMKELH